MQDNMPESENPDGSHLERLGKVGQEYYNRASQLNENARKNLPSEVQQIITPGRMFAEGIGKIILGSGFDIAGGILAGLATVGLSEVFPMEDYAIDFAVSKLATKITDRELRTRSKTVGYSLTWIPVLGEIINPTSVDGFIDICQSAKALYKAQRNPDINS